MHSRLLFTLLLVLGVLAIWGMLNHVRGGTVSRGYVSVLAMGELLVVSEFVIGVALLVRGRQPFEPALHILYGTVALITLPAVALYLRGRTTRWGQLIYAAACLFLCGIVLRALATGRGPG